MAKSSQKKKRHFSDTVKLSIIDEHLSGSSIYSLCKKYSLHSPQIYEWLSKYGIQKKQSVMGSSHPKVSESERIQSLEKELRQVQKALAEEQLRSAAYSKMIDLAEAMYQIDIRKKVGTKQSER